MKEDYKLHLLDIAHSTDRNIASLVARCRDEIDYAVENEANPESEYLVTHNKETMRVFLENLPILRSELISVMLMIEDREVTVSTGEEGYVFPYGCVTNEPCMCVSKEGNYFLAMVRDSKISDIQYAALIDLDMFYKSVYGTDMREEYWMTLYEKKTGLMLQNDSNQPKVNIITEDEALRRKDGVTILTESELNGETVTKQYRFTIKPKKEKSVILMAAIPTANSENGVFTVGIAAESTVYMNKLRSFSSDMLFYSLMIVAGTSVLLVLIVQNRRKNDEIREEVELLQLQNEKMQELAHHQRLETIGVLTSGISHEFNNLLTPIMSYSIMTMEKVPPENEDVLENLEEIYKASQKAKTLVSRLSDLARKNNEIRLKLVSPESLLESAFAMAKLSLPDNVTCQTDYKCNSECVLGDETQLSQMLLNLIINAIHAMKEKGGVLKLSTHTSNGKVIMSVSDEGKGIPKEIMDKIFEPFFTTKEKGHGTGLGLAIAQRIAEEHNGKIEIQSEVGVGTTIEVILPIHDNNK